MKRLLTRGQTEMMGLVIIVILITIGFFFAVSMNKGESTQKTPIDIYSDEQLSSNFLITLLETQVGTCNTINGAVTIRDLAIDCVRENVTRQQQLYCGDLSSCFVLHNVTETITNASIAMSDNFELRFTYTAPGDEPSHLLNITEGIGCPGIRNAPALQPIPLFRVVAGNAYFELAIC